MHIFLKILMCVLLPVMLFSYFANSLNISNGNNQKTAEL